MTATFLPSGHCWLMHDTFTTGFPGSAACMQGSKRFSSAVPDSGHLREAALKELGIESEASDGCLPD